MNEEQMIAKGKRWRFEPTITLGNIISAVGMIGTVLVFVITMASTLAKMEARIELIEQQIDTMRILADKIVQIQIDIATIRALYQSQISLQGTAGVP